MKVAECTVPGEPNSVPTVRRFVESILNGWGLADASWPAAQIISELATNCTLHARTAFTVRVIADGDADVRLEVSDTSPAAVQRRHYSDEATTGRGLRLVDTIAADWGVLPSAHGKTVWVRIPSDGSRPSGLDFRDPVDLQAYAAAFDVDSVVDGGGQPPRAELLLAA